MKLKAFRIKNFRSIVDSNWNNLAFDNITALIGQNESGKTSVLEALYSFYNGYISDDILRSDLTFPEVYCKFQLENEKLLELFDTSLLPPELIDILKDKKEVLIYRQWFNDRSSKVAIGEEDVLKFYSDKLEDKQNIKNKTKQEINALLTDANRAFNEIEIAEKEKQEAQEKLNQYNLRLIELQKAVKKAKKPDSRLIAENQFETVETEYKKAEEEFNNKIKQFEEKKSYTQEISEKVNVCKVFNQTSSNYDTANLEVKNSYSELKDVEHFFEMCTKEKEKRAASLKLEQAKSRYIDAVSKQKELAEHVDLQYRIVAKVFEGLSYNMAANLAHQEMEDDKKFYSAEDMGHELFKYIPVFEFFEDFSSLLPNKIDLEDVLTENIHAEGYKAAKNFLTISGLTPEFFREKNHRILKQKIENLNGTITINFQDYWRQNVGRNNKIRLNFELEHYDYTVPEKSGKPYLEFWIKDTQERLYPKQRSRGVRWFLSFYLELKATAKKNTVNRVLLIDEPGLSLHARAQEDVLKVFEDLKNDMQMIYSTHSPHLVNVNKLYRILAVQRADEEDEMSESLILDVNSLPEASSDTLSPIYSLMGLKLNEQQFIQKENNVIVEDSIVYYYLNSIYHILNPKKSIYFIPATGISNVPLLTNILTGWKLDYIVLLFQNKESNKLAENLSQTLFLNNPEIATEKIFVLEKFSCIENLFSTIDFKKYILNKRVGITESNSDYIENNGLSRIILASEFVNRLQDGNIKFNDLDEETQNNFETLFKKLQTLLQ